MLVTSCSEDCAGSGFVLVVDVKERKRVCLEVVEVRLRGELEQNSSNHHSQLLARTPLNYPNIPPRKTTISNNKI